MPAGTSNGFACRINYGYREPASLPLDITSQILDPLMDIVRGIRRICRWETAQGKDNFWGKPEENSN